MRLNELLPIVGTILLGAVIATIAALPYVTVQYVGAKKGWSDSEKGDWSFGVYLLPLAIVIGGLLLYLVGAIALAGIAELTKPR